MYYCLLGIAQTVVGKAPMSDDLKGAVITALVTSIISIIGFVVTNLSMRKNFKNELAIQRDSTALEKMATIPYDMLDYYDIIMKLGKSNQELEDYDKNNPTKLQSMNRKILKEKKIQCETEFLCKMNYLYNTIYAYGSETAIKIVSKMQSENYIAKDNPTQEQKVKAIAYMILLATQVKKDVTTIVVNPKYWLQMRLTDYNVNYEEIDKAINLVIDELELDKNFRI